jgi:uncharacterized protein
LAEVRVVELEGIELKVERVVEGLPDVGLVGTIATAHLVESLNLVEVGYVESELFPPVMVLHQGVLANPVRIFSDNRGLVAITSEIAIPPTAVYPLAKAFAEWFERKGVELVVSLGGFPVRNRLEILEPKVYGVANGGRALEILREKGVEVMEEGFVAGTYALIMKECMKRRIPAMGLLAQSFLQYPDPGAAAYVLKALNRLMGLKVDVSPLLERADEIRVKARDLMKQAQASMAVLNKRAEQEIPVMYR